MIAQRHFAGLAAPQTLQAVNRFFQSQFTYRTWQEPARPANTNETPLSRFLLTDHRGHCEYFATATVLLLRRLNIPARYAVGYAVHEAAGRGFVVRQRDAHAWCLVWHDGFWQDFDTTPASWVAEEARHASAIQFLSDLWSWIGFEFSKFRWGQTHLRRYFLWTLAPVLGLLLFQILFRRHGRRQSGKTKSPDATVAWPGLDSEFYQLEHRLAARGVDRQPGEPLAPWLRRATADPALADWEGSLRELLRLHYRYRFDPQGLSPSDREVLRLRAGTCLAGLVTVKGVPRHPR